MTARAGWLLGVAVDALTARERLDNAIIDLVELGQFPPCHTEPDAWFSDSPTVIETAVAACLRCPVIHQCRAYALADPRTSRYGVWASTPDPRQRDVLARYESRSA